MPVEIKAFWLTFTEKAVVFVKLYQHYFYALKFKKTIRWLDIVNKIEKLLKQPILKQESLINALGQLTTVRLSNCQLTTAQLSTLCKALEQNQSVDELVLTWTEIDLSGAYIVLEV